MTRALFHRFSLVVLVLLVAASAAAAQDDPEPRTAFSLSSSEIFTSKDNPAFYLTFTHLTQLDFRVYKIREAAKFFSGLADPHQLGGEEVPVATERSWIERIADWKRTTRGDVRRFFRDQVSYDYRVERRRTNDKQEIAQRVTLNRNTFAQVPLLNPDQLVTAWRELLPDLRDPEMRRIPLEVKEPGAYVVEAVSGLLRAYTVVILSDVGIVTKVSPGQMVVFAANRLTGEPQGACDVQVVATKNIVGSGTTAEDGVADVTLPAEKLEELVAVAQCGTQVIASDPGSWYLSEPARQLVGYIYTDKPIYRPGHSVHVKGILRWRERDALKPFDRPTAEISASDLNDKVVFRQSVKVDEFGSVHAQFPLTASAALGDYTVRIASGDEVATGSFEVQEYRRPEYEVIVTPASRFVIQGDELVATIQARYYFGQPVANAKVRYVVNRQGYYSPFRWDDGFEGEEGDSYFYGGDQNEEGELRLDAQGRGEIRIDTEPDENQRDYSLRLEAQVTDASSREISGNTVVHATYGPFLLTTQVSGYVFRAGQSITTSIRAIDYQGNARASVPVAVVLERVTYPDGRYNEPTYTQIGQSSVTLDANGSANAQLTLGRDAGTYRIRATAEHDDRDITDSSYVWVPGASEQVDEDTYDRYLEMLSDKKSYAPGDTAHLIVRGEAISGPVLVTKEGQHVSWHRLLRLNPSDSIDVPIDEGDVGDVYINLVYMREGRLYRADRRVGVPATQKALKISLTADRPVAKPQEPGVFTLNVTNAAGQPVKAQISLGVIDEAVYAIKTDDTPDPVRFFHRREYSRVGTTFSRDYYFTGYSGSDRLQLARRKRRPFTLADFKGDKEVQPQVRKDFPDAIYWIGNLVTDAAGAAKVQIKYPDSLTTWRLTARAVTTDTLAGAGVARTTTTKDLILRIVTPRFLTEGDQVVLPTIVHNYLQESKDTAISFDAKGLQPAGGGAPAPVSSSIAAAGERRDDWRFTANTVGTAVVTARAKTNSDTDAVELPVPVVPYGIRREVGGSGTLFEPEVISEVTIPADSNVAGRNVRVSLAPSMAGTLLGALDFLTSYPYGCTEQTLSTFLPNVVVTRALAQLKLVPTERMSVLDRQVSDGLKRLYDYQHDDYGWGWWKTDPNHPFMTAYALYGLLEAKTAGYKVDEYRIRGGLSMLASLYAEYPRAEPDLKAYMAFVLGRAPTDMQPISYRRAGQSEMANYKQADALNDLWTARDRMTAYGRALLLLSLDAVKDARGDELARALMAEAQTKGDLTWWTSDHDALLLHFTDTSVEATATAIRALARRDPRSPVLDRAVRWLMLNRSGGYWYTTKQTAMALYGLLELLQARNETPQPFTADVYVNGTLAGTHQFTTASMTEPDPVVVSATGNAGANRVRIVKRGGGTLYWSATSVYFDTKAAEARHGTRQLAITRKYARLMPVKNREGNIVYREEPFQGQMRPADVLTVRITVAGSDDWRYLVIEDPLPAGVEAIQDTVAYPLERPGRDQWWWGSRVEYRDSKTVFFQETFERGRYEYTYLVKAISSGEFRAVPAQIVPMYVPGVAASSEPQTVTVALPTGGQR